NQVAGRGGVPGHGKIDRTLIVAQRWRAIYGNLGDRTIPSRRGTGGDERSCTAVVDLRDSARQIHGIGPEDDKTKEDASVAIADYRSRNLHVGIEGRRI